jgi:NADPH-dependent curcumin reductase CurA
VLAARPQGLPQAQNWRALDEPARDPSDGEILLKTLYLSVDPAMRGWMDDRPSYLPPVEIGAVMRALGVGEVVASKHPNFAPGEFVTGMIGVQTYPCLSGDAVVKVDPQSAPLPKYLSVLGMTGMTAYFGLFKIGRMKAGETVVISAAAGAVGSIAGQLAKIAGCRTVGITGGAEKCAYLRDELGFDAAIDYKIENIHRALREQCPAGINVYFDNVGGEILDACLVNLAMHARVVICGAISQYNSEAMRGPANYMMLLVKRSRMEGFLVSDHAADYGKAASEMAGWLRDGKLRSHEEIVDGIDRFPETLLRLFTGEHVGKLLLQVAKS